MRTLKELYQIVLDSEYVEKYHSICLAIRECALTKLITLKEWSYLEKHFIKNRPTIFSKFWWNFYYNRPPLATYWWETNQKGDEQRIKFIKYLISKSK